MAKPTARDMYLLGMFRLMRIIGALFVAGSVLTFVTNIPGLLRSGDSEQWALTLAAGVAFPAISVLLFVVAGRASKQYRDYVDAKTAMKTCQMCKRPLDVETDPLSGDCGGDCWGCIGAIEADMGWESSVQYVELEINAGLRKADGTAKPYNPQPVSSRA
jgi:hypothetical protein